MSFSAFYWLIDGFTLFIDYLLVKTSDKSFYWLIYGFAAFYWPFNLFRMAFGVLLTNYWFRAPSSVITGCVRSCICGVGGCIMLDIVTISPLLFLTGFYDFSAFHWLSMTLLLLLAISFFDWFMALLVLLFCISLTINGFSAFIDYLFFGWFMALLVFIDYLFLDYLTGLDPRQAWWLDGACPCAGHICGRACGKGAGARAEDRRAGM